jgi:hypothetical protein
MGVEKNGIEDDMRSEDIKFQILNFKSQILEGERR